jgi:class 3 adenylate cyclase/tetratricopeptide (TPR) repeat protein
MGSQDTQAAELVSFVPRLTIEWLRSSPELRWLEIDGTLAFVDISGFTAMSEQLSERGRAGAEEVTDIMNSTFSALLNVAYAEGGGLLKFGGDALLLLYEGDEHAARAARAAFAMRRTLRAVGRPRTSMGAVTLKMHAGIHSGRFQFFLVGDSHRELLVSGPAATRTVEMEAASEAGEILVSPETAASLDPAMLGEPKGPGVLLAAPPEVRGVVAPLPDITGLALEDAVPAPLRAQLLEVGPLEGEHRHAAIAFVRFSGLDEIVATEGPVSAAEAVAGLVETLQAAAGEHDVTFLESDVDRDGGRIILVAGAPQTFGDDEERLLRTVRAAIDAGLPLPVHVGVSEGRVFAGQVGAPFRRTYTVLGDTAALAARLMARAGEDEIWVARDAFERGGARFAATELEPLTLKGKAEPVHAVVLGELLTDAAPDDDTGAAAPAPFVGRERERAILAASVAPVRMGFGTLVELVGEPGIGKSRLADELRANCVDMRQLTVRCEQYESSTPYHSFRPFLRTLLDVELNGGGEHNREVLAERLSNVDAELVPWAPLLAAPLDVEVDTTTEVDELDQSFRRARLHGVVGSLLGRILDSPTLLVFEDVHWMDDASSELLRFLGTQVSTHPWLTCTTRRETDTGFAAERGTPPLAALTLRLEPLSADDARALVEAAAGRTLSSDELATIAERGGGNPLFLQALAAPTDGAATGAELPETVEALVTTRIDRLAPGDRALLRWASVLGVSFLGTLIARVLESDPAAASDSEAWDRLAEFVERDPTVAGAFRFRHALIRDAAYEGLSYRRRRELHGRVADAIETQGPEPELLSLHYHLAERPAETWRWSLEAGRRAQAKWANLEAAQFYERALGVAANVPDLDAPELAAAWEALADCLMLAGKFDDAANAYASARELLPLGSRAQVELIEKEGKLRREMGRYAEAIDWYGEGLIAAARIDDTAVRNELELRLDLGYAESRFRQGEFNDCVRRAHAVVERALALDARPQLAAAYLLLHLAYTVLGSPERLAFRGLSLPLFEELGDLRGQATVLNNLGIEAYYEGDWDKALDVYRRSRALFERIGDVTSVAMTANNIGEILSDQGLLEEAEQLFREADETAAPAGHRALSALARVNLGRAAARAGRFDDAESLLAEAHASLLEIDAGGLALEAEVRLAESDALRGGRAEAARARAQSVLDRTADAADTAGLHAVALRVVGAAFLQLGRADDGKAALEESARIAGDAGIAYERALALDLLSAAGWERGHADESRALFARLHVERVTRPVLAG